MPWNPLLNILRDVDILKFDALFRYLYRRNLSVKLVMLLQQCFHTLLPKISIRMLHVSFSFQYSVAMLMNSLLAARFLNYYRFGWIARDARQETCMLDWSCVRIFILIFC